MSLALLALLASIAFMAGLDGTAPEPRLAALAIADANAAIPGCPQPNPNPGAAWACPPRPTSSDFPRRAQDRDASGTATIRCRTVASGIPTDCRILSETPPGYGFGRAALAVVERARLFPQRISPDEIGRTYDVRVPFNFR